MDRAVAGESGVDQKFSEAYLAFAEEVMARVAATTKKGLTAPKSRSGFSGLLTSPPAPLPDDDDQPAVSSAEVVAEPEPEPAPAPPPAEVRRIDSLSAQRADQVREPQRRAARESTVPTASVAPVATAGERAATTIRLHQPAAAALNQAWLNERMHVNPTLSKPEFASEIVRLGLVAFERQAKRR